MLASLVRTAAGLLPVTLRLEFVQDSTKTREDISLKPVCETSSREREGPMKLIELDDVSLHFHVRCRGRESLKDYLLHGLFRRSKRTCSKSRPSSGST